MTDPPNAVPPSAVQGRPPSSSAPGLHLALVGPTASGKSAVGLALAELRNAAGLPTEIVSCDSMQVYRGMDIGTASPTPAERARVRHHLLDIVDPTEDHNLPRFLVAARAALEEIEARGVSAILLGGTGLYVRALVDGFDPPPHFPGIAAALEEEPTEELTERLRGLDPAALAHVPAGNRRRLVRALEVTIGTGTPFSQHGRPLDEYPPTPVVLAGLWPDRDVLSARIDARYEAQLAQGFLEEVAALGELGDSLSRTAVQALGYRELLAHRRGESTLEEAIRTARVRTRRFAVRQQRWFGRDPRIAWFDPPGALGSDGTTPTVAAVAGRIDDLWRKRAGAHLGSLATVDPGPAPTAAPTAEPTAGGDPL